MYRIINFLFLVNFEIIRFLKALKNVYKLVKESTFNLRYAPSYLFKSDTFLLFLDTAFNYSNTYTLNGEVKDLSSGLRFATH